MVLKELASREDYTDYGAWSHGVEVRVFAHPGMDASVTVRVDGWASAETLAAHDRGERGPWPTYFYTVRTDGPATGYKERPLAGGKVPVSELERRASVAPGASPLDLAWAFVFEQVEAAL